MKQQSFFLHIWQSWNVFVSFSFNWYPAIKGKSLWNRYFFQLFYEEHDKKRIPHIPFRYKAPFFKEIKCNILYSTDIHLTYNLNFTFLNPGYHILFKHYSFWKSGHKKNKLWKTYLKLKYVKYFFLYLLGVLKTFFNYQRFRISIVNLDLIHFQ